MSSVAHGTDKQEINTKEPNEDFSLANKDREHALPQLSHHTKRALIAEDHMSIGETYKMVLELEGYEVVLSSDGQDCLEKFDAEMKSLSTHKIGHVNPGQSMDTSENSGRDPFDVIILDYHLPRKDGIDLVKHIHSVAPGQRIIIASSYPKEIILKAAENLVQHSVELITKPFDLIEFVDIVTNKKIAETIGGPSRVRIHRVGQVTQRVVES